MSRKRPPPSTLSGWQFRVVDAAERAVLQQVRDVEARDQQHATGGGQHAYLGAGFKSPTKVIDQRPDPPRCLLRDEGKGRDGHRGCGARSPGLLVPPVPARADAQASASRCTLNSWLSITWPSPRASSCGTLGKEDLHLLLGKSEPTRHYANDGVGFGTSRLILRPITEESPPKRRFQRAQLRMSWYPLAEGWSSSGVKKRPMRGVDA